MATTKNPAHCSKCIYAHTLQWLPSGRKSKERVFPGSWAPGNRDIFTGFCLSEMSLGKVAVGREKKSFPHPSPPAFLWRLTWHLSKFISAPAVSRSGGVCEKRQPTSLIPGVWFMFCVWLLFERHFILMLFKYVILRFPGCTLKRLDFQAGLILTQRLCKNHPSREG